MSETAPIQHWCYPFKSNLNALEQLTLFAKAKGGYFPIGANGLWHGGVHFDVGTAAMVDQSQAFCIADGEVIAYRVDETYPVSEYPTETPQPKRAPFSTGFVLVKHRLEPPALVNHPHVKRPSLTLYSLYMHLLDWDSYDFRPELPRPAFWGEALHIVNTQSGGLNVRTSPSDDSMIVGQLSKGAQLQVSGKGAFLKVEQLKSGVFIPAKSIDQTPEPKGYVAAKFLKTVRRPIAMNEVVVLKKPVEIKAGELIGHPGLYQNLTDDSPQLVVHLEVFSCDDVPAFIAQSRTYSASLPDSERTLLKIHKHASKLIPHRAEISVENPPRITDRGTTVGVDLIIPQSLLDELPADAKLITAAKNGLGETKWWRLDGLLVDKDNHPINGWLAEQDLITTRHSPWEWEGYECIEDTGASKAKLASWLDAAKQLTREEQVFYEPLINMDRGGPIKAKLRDILDTNHDGIISARRIRNALAKPWHAQEIGQLIINSESEWIWSSDSWGALDSFFLTPPKSADTWQIEKERIKTLCYWKSLSSLNHETTGARTWNLHPIALISNRLTIEDDNNIKWLIVPKGQLTFDAEGNDLDTTRYFSRRVHWPSVGNSGITIGRGYDIGHQPEVVNDLKSVNISEPLLSWLIGAIGLKQKNAETYLNTANENIISTRISRKQQYMLFLKTYKTMEDDVIRICNKIDVIESYGATDWKSLNQKIKDILIDLRYRGDYTPKARKEIQKHVSNNDLHNFTKAIGNRALWPMNLPTDRFNRRLQFLSN
jgi:hypothetical protein